MTRPASNMLRCLLAAALLVQLAMRPAVATPDMSGYLCSETGRASAEAVAAVRDLLALVGETENDSDPAPHCPDCIAPNIIAGAPPHGLLVPASRPRSDQTFPAQAHARPCVRGPPLGSRAPPLSS
ncbi:hypothetical protein [uncultured Algimonas sp.]|uniref:hypothetical protein n=1 Tax=uncultured Algimonas sp. TaxID=1547920 RepID=UPI0026331E73|nr:hypothetical protein [uncultured Algimonas sp.]